MLKKIFGLLPFAIAAICLTSCGGFCNQNTPSVDYSSLSNASNSVTYYDIYSQNGQNLPKLNSIGNQKILVLPINILGPTAAKKNLPSNDLFLANLQDTFFGETADTYWESVSSYYKKSSYGKLNLSGTVAPIYSSNTYYYNVPYSSTDASGALGAAMLGAKALENYKKITGDNCKDFDIDGDGYIDAVWLIYDVNCYENYDYDYRGKLNKNTLPFWAYTTNYYTNKANKNSPTINNFAWASFDFMYNQGTNNLDAHTYIHETGHLLGLDDYYDTEGKTSPMGWIDMMDYNVGDHNAFSKYALGWISPKVVDSSATVTLNSLTETGEAIILKPQQFLNIPFCEYFMLMYVTPTYLNYKDYALGYYTYKDGLFDRPLRVYSEPGLMILHVSAYFGKTSGNKFNISTKPYSMEEPWVNNSSGYGYDKINLVQIMQANYLTDSNSIFGSNFFASNSCLFHRGETFSLTSNSKYRNLMYSGTNEMNDQTLFNYSVYVNSSNSTNCSVTISIC